MLALWKKRYDHSRQHIKEQKHYFANKGPSSQSYGFSSSHVWMWVFDHKAECRRIDAFELWCWRRFLSPLNCKIKPINPKRNQPLISIGRTDSEVEALILWPTYVKNRLIGKDSDAGKDWRWEDKMMTEDEMVGWHHQLPELAETHICQVSNAIQPRHPLLSPSSPAFNHSQHQGLFKWVSSSHQVAKVLELQLQL